MRKPDAGNPHVRFEEGEGTPRSLAQAFHSVRPSLLYFSAYWDCGSGKGIFTEGNPASEAGETKDKSPDL